MKTAVLDFRGGRVGTASQTASADTPVQEGVVINGCLYRHSHRATAEGRNFRMPPLHAVRISRGEHDL